MVYRTTHICGLEDGAILIEETLMISQMIGVDLKEVPDEWKSLWTWDFPDWFAIDANCGGFLVC